MSKYVSSRDLAHAVRRLEGTSPRGRMMVFLIGLRTLTLADENTVAVAESVPAFVRALKELTYWPLEDDAEAPNPYFNPFDKGSRYKGPRFPSNGPGNTMHGWATQDNSPFEIHGDVSPKAISRNDATSAQLQRFLLVGQPPYPERPRLIDIAVWYFRKTDVEMPDGSSPSRTQLEDLFVSQVGLTDADVASLFRREDEDAEEDLIADDREADVGAAAETEGPAVA